MVGDMLALSPAPEPFVQFLSRQSEGNPFFVAEMLRAAVAEGLLDRDAKGRWQVTAAGAPSREGHPCLQPVRPCPCNTRFPCLPRSGSS